MTKEKVAIHRNLSVEDFEKIFKDAKGTLRPRKNGRRKIFLVAYTGHGCQANSSAFCHAVTDCTFKASAYNIEAKLLEIGMHEESSILGILGCCRNEVMLDAATE